MGIASAVVVGDRYYLVDAGEGVGPRLRQAGLGDPLGVVQNGPLRDLRAIFLTHLHSDHVSDLNNILSSGLHNGLQKAPEKIQVWGPGNRGVLPELFGEGQEPPIVAPENPTPGTREMVELMVRTFATDYNDRVRDNRFPVPDQLFEGFDVPIPERYLADPNGNPHPRMSPVPFYEDDRVRVSATLVMHAPVFPALAFRFDTEDGSIVISGDTGVSENLVELAEGADILAHEVMDRQWAESLFPQPRDPGSEGLFQHMIRSHTLAEELGPLAERAGVETLVLHHLVPGNGAPNSWNEAKRGFSGRMIVGQDLDEIGVGRPNQA
ncbi:putative hydrolase [Arthrobacter crystallopoietes BAB-32]|uniref:Putative hydrolase n=1 Tax=Arthrobacter crystallopoietes BAB-32 TaxID=1246476 RepID=N1V593_9MICC|nr:MBL fold metallo-hydrolase [Arthrobacter crystallopoietes]EMY35184.1 putative hydrolase [Arthrobacter crystallopoietes BAB-32]